MQEAASGKMRVTARWLSKIRAMATGNSYVQAGTPEVTHEYGLRSKKTGCCTQPGCARGAAACCRQYYTGRAQEGQPPKVVHDRGAEQFYMDFMEMGKAYLSYEIDGDTIRLLQTFVPEELRGYQLAERLANVSSILQQTAVAYMAIIYSSDFDLHAPIAGRLCLHQGE